MSTPSLYFLYAPAPNPYTALTRKILHYACVRDERTERSEWRILMDLLFLGLAVLLFALTWGFVALCERL